MHKHFSILLLLTACINGRAQSKAGFEQYTYIGGAQGNIVSPLVHYQSKSKWYTEARYNYEDTQTFSLYAGKTFSAEHTFAYSLTPMLGGMAGKMRGGLVGLNMECSYKQFYFSSQSQYGVSADGRADNFFFSWSELGYQPLTWIYAGVSLQHTQLYQTSASVEPGVLLGFSGKQWTIPVYGFNMLNNDQYFIVGFNWEWKHKISKKNNPPTLSYSEGGKL